MTILYVVIASDTHQSQLCGAFSNKERAERFVEDMQQQVPAMRYSIQMCPYIEHD